MKIFTYILIGLAFGLIVFNCTQLDYSDLFSEKNSVGMIGIVASFCAVFILLIFKTSKSIEDKLKG
jgi:tetrahydromethanopterin S-methyltransferase subunit E